MDPGAIAAAINSSQWAVAAVAVGSNHVHVLRPCIFVVALFPSAHDLLYPGTGLAKAIALARLGAGRVALFYKAAALFVSTSIAVHCSYDCYIKSSSIVEVIGCHMTVSVISSSGNGAAARQLELGRKPCRRH